MMKMIARTFGVAGLCAGICCVCLCASAATPATVTPATANGYHFSTPVYPAHIRGVVMGDPPAYLTPRREDLDWLAEAARERIALREGRIPDPDTHLYPEFGKWELSATNRFHAWATAVDAVGTTNVVVGYHLVTNTPSSFGMSPKVGDAYRLRFAELSFNAGSRGSTSERRYLDGAASLSSTARAAYDWGAPPLITNVTIYADATNGYLNAYSTIDEPMTNGTVSVHTNKWIATVVLPYSLAVTNVFQALPLDYCHDGVGLQPFPVYTNAVQRNVFFYSYPGDVPSTRHGSFAQMYRALRGAVRLADHSSCTNNPQRYVDFSHMVDTSNIGYDITSYSTNSTTSGPDYSLWTDNHPIYSYTLEESLEGGYYYVRHRADSWYVSEKKPQTTHETIAPTRFDTDLVTVGNTVRVEIDAAFAAAEFEYADYVYTGDDTSGERWELENVSRIHKMVVVPLTNTALDLSQPVALARIGINPRVLCETAAKASGAPSPPQITEHYEPPKEERQIWRVKCNSVVLVYRLHPTSKFTDW